MGSGDVGGWEGFEFGFWIMDFLLKALKGKIDLNTKFAGCFFVGGSLCAVLP